MQNIKDEKGNFSFIFISVSLSPIFNPSAELHADWHASDAKRAPCCSDYALLRALSHCEIRLHPK